MKKNYIIIATIILAQILLFQNCSTKVGFSGPGIESTSSTDPECTISFIEETGTVKLLFMIDTSGSNVANNSLPGTDPGKVWRGGVLENFLAAYPNKPNFHYNVSIFGGGVSQQARSLVNVNSNGQTSYFSNNITPAGPVQAAFDAFGTVSDTGGTPYEAAVSRIRSIITNDMTLNPGNVYKYSVIFISDGEPSDYSHGSNLVELKEDVKSVVDLAPERISFNTVYYNNHQFTQNAETVLRAMAIDVGKGTFIKANTSGGVIDISDTIRIPITNCQ